MIACMGTDIDHWGYVGMARDRDESCPQPCDRTRALVVDDERGVAALFVVGIRQDIPAIEVDSAENGLAAYEAFRKGHHGVLVMDVNMPVMDGQRAFRKIEEHCRANNWEMPSVLFCTSYAPSGSLQKFLSNPAHGLLLKPITGKEVAKAVKSRLGKPVRDHSRN